MKLSILFYPRLDRCNTSGVYPIVCRITLNKRRTVFSTAFFVERKYWNQKRQLLRNSAPNAFYINQHLDKLKAEVKEHYFKLQMRQELISINSLVNALRGEEIKPIPTVLSYFQLYLDEMKELVPFKYTLQTFYTVRQAFNYLKRYLEEARKVTLTLDAINLVFADKFRNFLIAQNYKSSTINKALKNFLMVYNKAFNESTIKEHKLKAFKLSHVKRDICFLPSSQLQLLEDYHPIEENLQRIKDCFIFSCYTGMAYQEVKSFTFHDIYVDTNNQKCITIARQKTKKKYEVPLLPKAASIVNKYVQAETIQLPIISNQKMNKHLKILASKAHLSHPEKLTFHIGRKTFATTVCLSNGVSMEVVSKLLGHSSTKITEESYASVSNQLITRDMKELKTSPKATRLKNRKNE